MDRGTQQATYSPWGRKRVRHNLATTQQKSLGRVGKWMWGCLLGDVDSSPVYWVNYLTNLCFCFIILSKA